jgi:hypothetical protein
MFGRQSGLTGDRRYERLRYLASILRRPPPPRQHCSAANRREPAQQHPAAVGRRGRGHRSRGRRIRVSIDPYVEFQRGGPQKVLARGALDHTPRLAAKRQVAMMNRSIRLR